MDVLIATSYSPNLFFFVCFFFSAILCMLDLYYKFFPISFYFFLVKTVINKIIKSSTSPVDSGLFFPIPR